MSTIKVDTVKNRSSAINLPNNFKIGGLSIIQGYTSSGSEPGSPATGDFWWDSSNDKLYRYIDGGFKELSTASASNPWSGDRGVFAAGSGPLNVMEYVNIASAGNSTDFGDLSVARHSICGTSNSTRGVYAGGRNAAGNDDNTMDYITFSTTGNATDFGNLDVTRHSIGKGTTSALLHKKETHAVLYDKLYIKDKGSQMSSAVTFKRTAGT